MPVWRCSFKTGAKALAIETEANDCYNTHRGWIKTKETTSEVQIAHLQLACALCSIVVQQLAIASTNTVLHLEHGLVD